MGPNKEIIYVILEARGRSINVHKVGFTDVDLWVKTALTSIVGSIDSHTIEEWKRIRQVNGRSQAWMVASQSTEYQSQIFFGVIFL